MRVLDRDLGRFNSRLVAFSAQGGRTICYGLLGKNETDPAVSYCYRPKGSELPAGLAGQHFHALAPQYYIDGQYGVQLVGVAFDDVVGVRAQIDGSWIDVPLTKNGFYLDLPGMRNEQVGLVEATLRNGSTQSHDIQTGH